MLEKLLEKFNRTAIPDRVNVIRHRVATRIDGLGGLTGRGRSLVAITAAAAMIGLGALAAHAAVTDSDASSSTTVAATVDPALAEERDAEAERTDRSERSSSAKEPAKEQETKAEAPKSSPTPSEEAEEEPESEPEPAEDEADEAEEEEEAETQQAPADWVHPMPGAATTSCYGQRWGVLHAGVDLAAASGTPIKAVGAGTVTDAGWVFGGYGISVVVDHHNGVYTHYAHMSDTAVSPGDSVSPGETIGYEGSTGDSTGPHLHFEVHNGMWNQIEPTSWMRDRGVNIGGC